MSGVLPHASAISLRISAVLRGTRLGSGFLSHLKSVESALSSDRSDEDKGFLSWRTLRGASPEVSLSVRSAAGVAGVPGVLARVVNHAELGRREGFRELPV